MLTRSIPLLALGRSIGGTLWGVILGGQSNTTGTYTASNFFSEIPDVCFSGNAFMFSQGVLCGISPVSGNVNVSDPPLTTFAPLAELDDTTGFHGETVATGFAAQMALYDPSKRFIFHSWGIDGTRYSSMAQGTTPYTNMKTQVTAGRAIAAALGMTYKVLCVLIIHGEADQSFLNTSYGANLLTWYNNINTDLLPLTGQTEVIPLYIDQQGGCAQASFSATTETQSSVYQLWQASISNPTKIIMANPRYMWNSHADKLHVAPYDRFHQGALLAKVAWQNQFLNIPWTSFVCTSATISGAVITANFNVPVSPMVSDFTRVVYAPNLGFTYTDDTSPPAISTVSLSGTTATVTLASTPTTVTPSTRRLRYAWGGTSQGCQGFGFQSAANSTNRGNVCDSDAGVLANGYDGRNWLNSFSIVVN